MSNGVLNARLLCAAELVRQGATFADIGTDHAYLPIFLLECGRIGHAYCTDINEGPLASARKNTEEHGLTDKSTFILCDGAEALCDRGITDYAICGMGGELIADIIDRAPFFKERGVNLILQPMSKQSKLRKYLAFSGFEIVSENYSYDGGKYYVCFLATYGGESRRIDEIEAELGSSNSSYSNTDARVGYIKEKIRALTRAYNGKILGGENEPNEKKIIDAARELLKLIERKNL